ncbi:MAG: hypothetical protein R2875_04410 [Desulfobacterales bacterium]
MKWAGSVKVPHSFPKERTTTRVQRDFWLRFMALMLTQQEAEADTAELFADEIPRTQRRY